MIKKEKTLSYHYGADKNTFTLAKELRKKSTLAEKILWKLLRNRLFEGYKFRRQHPVGRYVVDFYCHQSLLVIELDGEVHNDKTQIEYDFKRDEFMKNLGLNILRISNEDVYNNKKKVLQLILKNL